MIAETIGKHFERFTACGLRKGLEREERSWRVDKLFCGKLEIKKWFDRISGGTSELHDFQIKFTADDTHTQNRSDTNAQLFCDSAVYGDLSRSGLLSRRSSVGHGIEKRDGRHIKLSGISSRHTVIGFHDLTQGASIDRDDSP